MRVTVDLEVKRKYLEQYVEQNAAALVEGTGVDEINPNLEADLLKANLGDYVLIGYKNT